MAVGKGMMLLPTCNPEGPNETGVPAMVATLPGARVMLPIKTTEFAIDAGRPPTVTANGTAS